MGDGGVADTGQNVNQSHVLFDRFVQASTCKGTLKAFQELCDFLELKPNEYRIFYHKLKTRLNYWKAKALWAKLDKRACLKDYKKGRACINTKCLIIGAGPCGLRTAIELAFLGAKVVLLEKRDAFSRNNVLHLWPFTIQDLRGLGAKKFYGKFCAGAIDHISIRQLQLILLKVALLLGIEIHVNVEFRRLIEPPEDQENERIGWRAEVHPRTHPVNEFEFDVIIGADGRRNTLPGFRRKEFRGKLAIAITANFINRNTTAEAKVEEISGVAFIFNQKFFQDLREATGIDLENIVYYKDDTHYFVMTAKKQSLLDKGVILHDYADTELLLSRANVDQTALLAYARQAADFSTNRQLPQLDFAINHYGQPDVAMFDFTCMYASENAALVRQRNSHQLLVALVGDSLLEPFWPMGTGIARGFLAAMDSAWMVRSWAQGNSALEVLAERESIYRLLPQTTPENVSKNFSQYSVDPTTRYPNISLHFLRPNQVRHLIDTGESRDLRVDMENVVNASTPKLLRNDSCEFENVLQDSIARSSKLLSWCQRQTNGYRNIAVTDLTMSWKSGLALCAIIHRYRPDLIDFDCLEEWNQEKNNQLAFDVAEREFGISPIMTGKEMASVGEPDKLSMVMYLSQFYEMFKDTVPPGENHNLSPEEKAALIASTKSPISFLSKLGQSISRKRNPKDKKEKDTDGTGKRRKTSLPGLTEDEEVPRGLRGDRPLLSTALTERRMDAVAGGNNNKVKSMASQLLAKFEENAPVHSTGLKRQARSTASGSRSCPKKIIVLSSSSNSSLSLHTQEKVSCPTPADDHVPEGNTHKFEKPQLMKKPSRFFMEQWYQSRGLQPDSALPSPETPGQESQLLQPEDQSPVRISSVQERAVSLASKFTDKPEKSQPKKKPSSFFLEQWHLSRGLRSGQPLSSPNTLRQRYVKMYTGGVSLLAEQITNQLQSQEEPKPLLDKKELCSLRKEFPQNVGGSDVCFFCHKRVYVMERLSAEGKFFHRSCFICDYCGTTLRLSSYAFDLEDGKFYCKPHYCYRLSGQAQRKRPAPANTPLTIKEDKVALTTPTTVESPGRVMATAAPNDLRPPVAEVNGVLEAGLAKRPRGTPERIELENYHLSLQREEELEEVPEETLAEHNLSSVLDKPTDADEGSSSESEMEGEDEEQEEEHEILHSPRDTQGASWLESGQLAPNVKEGSPLGAKVQDRVEAGVVAEAQVQEVDDDEEEEEEEEDDDDDEEESSDEGEYCPWETELHSGLWLENLKDEEDMGTFKARNLRIQQALDPVDPLTIQHKGQEEGREEASPAPGSQSSPTAAPAPSSSRHEAVRAWLESISGEPCDEDEDLEAEAGSCDMDAVPDLLEEDIPSDAEAEARLHILQAREPVQEDEEKSESHDRVSSLVPSSISPMETVGAGIPPPVEHVWEPEALASCEYQSPSSLVKSPGMHFFPEPHVENKVKQESTLQAQDTMGPASPDSPLAPVPLVCLQPELQLETVAPKSPIRSQSFTCSPPSNPLSPVCSQPLPCEASSIALSSDSPVQGQPGPAVASTPLAKSPPGNNTKVNRLLESAEQTPVKKADLIEEFWMKSAEIRKSLGLTPLERSRGPERIVMAPTSDLLSPKVNTPQDLPEELKPVFSGRAVIRRLNITVEGQVVSPPDKEPKSTSSDKRDLSSSSGLGLNGSLPTSQTFNTSDSTMLTPPSSPPPPPPNEEPAMLSDTSHVSWDRKPEPVEPPEDSTQSPASSPSPAPAPVEVQAAAVPVPAPRTIPVSAVILRRETSKPRQDEKRKSFVESVEEIPFADDVDDTYDYRTPDNSLQEKFYTPPTSKPQRERPPLHLALAMENGKPNIPRRHRDVSEFSPEAKEIAEERMRAREKNVKSQALKEAMAKQISKMKELDSPKGSSKVAWNVSSESSAKNEKPSVNVTPPKTSALKAQEARKHAETLPERFFSSHSSRSLEGSAASSEGSTGCKSKKRSSLFSPRKSKKEKKVKSEGRTSEKNGQEDLPKHKSLWKTVFAGYKKEKKKKDDKSWPSTPSSVTTVDSGKKRTSPLGRSSDLNLRRNLSFSEDSDLSCDDVLERSKADLRLDIFDLVSNLHKDMIKEEEEVVPPKEESVYVPHALAFKRGYAIKKKYTEEELNAKLTRRVQKAARRQAKQEELKRLHRAQIIQRQLEQVEEKQRQLEERGVAVEKALRGEAVEPNVGTPRRRPISFCPCCIPEGMGKKDDPKLMQEWFKLVQEKNALVRYESELMIFARELELEDRQSRLQQELRERMAVEDHLKSEAELSEEKQILNEMLEVVEQRDALVALLEEQRLREKEEDRDLEAVMLSKGFDLNWA
ncbi:protein-methionine sulfoxide oxidase mical3a-like isoform X2 [Scleropages formosus]|uniref:protein-methionine sulfoxide oxidase mical3a-like isoform X2 n=1 Tax=Scleropages formosus TaxID=113540 RepID=UPI000878561D|nr:protein-methionine sulfoxide oxidase mical3a-like isoform X2 [Scleropages formosus]